MLSWGFKRFGKFGTVRTQYLAQFGVAIVTLSELRSEILRLKSGNIYDHAIPYYHLLESLGKVRIILIFV